MHTCIHHDGALGDAVLSLPCIRAIARDAGTVEWIGRGDVGTLLASLGVVHAAHDAGGSRFAPWHAPRPEARELDLLDRFDRVFLFTARPDSDLAKNIRAKVPDTMVIVTVPREGGTHVADYRSRQLPPELRHAARSGLAVPAGLAAQADSALARAGYCGHRQVITLHPGSGGRQKCWHLDRYFALADQLVSRTAAFILFLSGPAETGETAARIEEFVRGRERTGCIAGCALPVAAALLSRSELFVGNDSGVSHLAAAMGTPVIALFGPTDPALWAPVGKNVQVIAAPSLEEIPVDEVLAGAVASFQQTTRGERRIAPPYP
jgi:ADP-heptose:LPS heptosyltransferase